MTKEEAIEIIQHIYDVCLSDELREAFPIVLDALEAQDRPIICPRCGRVFAESEGRE